MVELAAIEINNLYLIFLSIVLSRFGILRSSYVHSVFQTATGGIYRALWDSIKHDQGTYLLSHNLDGMQKTLQDRNYAFLLEKSFYDTLGNKDSPLRNKSCEFARAKESFMTAPYAFPFQKGSPYTAQFSTRCVGSL